jgi:hypothetical protein
MVHTRITPRSSGPMARDHRAAAARPRKLVSLLMAGLLVIGLGAGTALASGGSAYVTSGCDYASLQDNTIVSGDLVYVWIKFTGGNDSVTGWTTVDNSGNNFQEGALLEAGCTRGDGKYVLYLADGFDSSELGSYTLTAWNGAKSISGDAFRVVAVPA